MLHVQPLDCALVLYKPHLAEKVPAHLRAGDAALDEFIAEH